MENKIAIVDVDSTLWDFLTPMKAWMRERYPHKNIPEEFDSWAHPEEFFDSFDEMMECFTFLHERQEQYEPFEGSVELLNTLTEKGYSIVIASNRPPHTRPQLINWLHDKGLVYDEVFADHDKSILFDNPDVVMLVDDRPSTQVDGVERGWLVMTLEYKYNQDVKGTFKFDTVPSMINFLKKSVKDEKDVDVAYG